MPRVRDVDHHDAGVFLPGPGLCRVIGAGIEKRWSILRKRALALELADEFQVAVVAAFRLAARTLIRCRLTLQSGFGSIHPAASGLGHGCLRWDGLGGRALRNTGLRGRCGGNPEQTRGQRDGCDGGCLEDLPFHSSSLAPESYTRSPQSACARLGRVLECCPLAISSAVTSHRG